MSISATMVKELREKTGTGMMDCKKALEATDGDLEKAVLYLREKGVMKAAKRADKAANEGMVVTGLSEDASEGYILEVNCETDFVARNEDFSSFTGSLLEHIKSSKPKSLDDLLKSNASFNSGAVIEDMVSDLIAKIGEKIEVKRFDMITNTKGRVAEYVHPGNRLAVIVGFNVEGKADEDALAVLAKDISMQVAAAGPICVDRSQVDKEIVERELEVYRTQARNENKPEKILDKIAQGKLEKFFQETCLLEQAFVKDTSMTIRDLLESFKKTGGASVTISGFKRYRLGE